MESREVLARNLRKLRQQQGLSQEALAHEAGVDRTYISALERGVYGLSITMIDSRLCDQGIAGPGGGRGLR